MATRESIDECLNRCEAAMMSAQKQYELAQRQEPIVGAEFSVAQQQLEEVANDLEKLSVSANAQQKEQLYRKNLQIQQLQNKMILSAGS